MADQRADEHIQQSGAAMKRRGILAAAAAVVAGIVAKVAEAPVLATSGGGDQGFLALGSNPWYTAGIPPGPNNPAISSAPTVIQASPNFGNFVGQNGADVVLFEVDARPSSGTVDAIYGLTDGSGYGVFGAGFYGVYGNGTNTGVNGIGTSTGVSGFGATGVSGAGSSIGISGSGTSFGVTGVGATGVFGQSAGAGGIAVRGNIPTSSGVNTIAVYGENSSTNTGGAPGAGGFGAYGFSLKGHGLVGATGTTGGAAVVGATNGVPGAYAGVFYGPFVVVGGPKSAAVVNDDGSHSLLYCVESPESWFEDFGKGTLEGGRAEINIDPAFAAVVDLCDYHVFITTHGDFQLHVSSQALDRFTVQQTTGAGSPASSGTFSWRLVAKRKDIEAPRLAKIVLPREPQRPDPSPTLPADLNALPLRSPRHDLR